MSDEEAQCACCGCMTGLEEHHGLWWCYICVGRGHEEDPEWAAELRAKGTYPRGIVRAEP